MVSRIYYHEEVAKGLKPLIFASSPKHSKRKEKMMIQEYVFKKERNVCDIRVLLTKSKVSVDVK